MKTLENEWIVLKTTPQAGQMLSIYDKIKERELLYQGDEGWSGRNPSLFPMVGSTWKEGEYEIDGQTYRMKNHGLIRYANLNEEEKDGAIIYTFDSDEETKKHYPFDFHYEMKYTIDGSKVTIDYSITNTGDKPMPFSFGLHPAFKTSQSEEEKFEDFSLEFFDKGECQQIVFYPDLRPVECRTVDLSEWQLSRKDLEEYATLVYENPKATRALLKYRDEPRVAMNFTGYPYLALWSHPTPSDFVCIEPWHGHADFEKVEVPFEKREGTEILEPHQTFKASYSIEAL